uniref:Secreted protein n=1 Tax=Ascaris lumbricoides TaxID=6252 RepID=A0A0M3ID59_ASCLU
MSDFSCLLIVAIISDLYLCLGAHIWGQMEAEIDEGRQQLGGYNKMNPTEPQMNDLPIEMADDDDMPELIETDPGKALPSLIEQNLPPNKEDPVEFTQVL